MELKTCLPTPVDQLPPFLSQFVEMGRQSQEEHKGLDPQFASHLIGTINFKVQRLWTFAMASGKAFSMMMSSPTGYVFVAFVVKDGEELHSILELPSGLAFMASDTLLAMHNAVADEELNAILCMTGNDTH